ncbi:MAG: hypothetical protein Q8R79_05770 [Legionellaceae bacterium]|nr:hypothetical protein [Legionellaceae bacterium]
MPSSLTQSIQEASKEAWTSVKEASKSAWYAFKASTKVVRDAYAASIGLYFAWFYGPAYPLRDQKIFLAKQSITGKIGFFILSTVLLAPVWAALGSFLLNSLRIGVVAGALVFNKPIPQLKNIYAPQYVLGAIGGAITFILAETAANLYMFFYSKETVENLLSKTIFASTQSVKDVLQKIKMHVKKPILAWGRLGLILGVPVGIFFGAFDMLFNLLLNNVKSFFRMAGQCLNFAFETKKFGRFSWAHIKDLKHYAIFGVLLALPLMIPALIIRGLVYQKALVYMAIVLASPLVALWRFCRETYKYLTNNMRFSVLEKGVKASPEQKALARVFRGLFSKLDASGHLALAQDGSIPESLPGVVVKDAPRYTFGKTAFLKFFRKAGTLNLLTPTEKLFASTYQKMSAELKKSKSKIPTAASNAQNFSYEEQEIRQYALWKLKPEVALKPVVSCLEPKPEAPAYQWTFTQG